MRTKRKRNDSGPINGHSERRTSQRLRYDSYKDTSYARIESLTMTVTTNNLGLRQILRKIVNQNNKATLGHKAKYKMVRNSMHFYFS